MQAHLVFPKHLRCIVPNTDRAFDVSVYFYMGGGGRTMSRGSRLVKGVSHFVTKSRTLSRGGRFLHKGNRRGVAFCQ